MEKRTYQAPDFEMERFAMDAMDTSNNGNTDSPDVVHDVETEMDMNG